MKSYYLDLPEKAWGTGDKAYQEAQRRLFPLLKSNSKKPWMHYLQSS
jgi:hypothetical protein